MNLLGRRMFFLLLFAALLLRAWVYVESGRHIPVTTDEAITVLQAKRIAEGELQWLMYAQPYMIPFEAYATVPLLWLPRNAFGMRALVVLEGLALMALSLWILRRMGRSWVESATGVLLVFFPSAYVLTTTFGYSFPHNNSAYLLALVAVAGAQALQREDLTLRTRLLLLAGTGFFCGLAFSNAMLTTTLIAPLILVAVLQGSWRRVPLHALGLAPGFLLGLTPYLYTRHAFPGSHVGVSHSRDLAGAWSVVKNHLIDLTLPRTLGVGAPVFPDEPVYGLDAGGFVAVFGYLLVVAFAGLALRRAIVHLRVLRRGECPTFTVVDLTLGVFLANLIAFAKSARSSHADFRYLVPIAVILPFAFAGFQQQLRPWGARLLLAVTALYAGFNVYSMHRNIQVWKQPDFASHVVNAPDLGPALALLDKEGIRHCYAQHWTAYRINFLTDERILCSQSYNERFPTWPLPYKAEVDAAENVAFVLTDRNRFITPDVLRAHLLEMGVSFREATAGHYQVFLDFRHTGKDSGFRPLPADAIKEIRSPYFRGDLRTLWTDGNLFSRTHSPLQEDGMYFEVELTEPVRVGMLRYNLGFWREDEPEALKIEVRVGGEWVLVEERAVPRRDPFTFRNGHPVYGGNPRRVRFQPWQTDTLRISVVGPNPRRAWTFSELELMVPGRGP